MILLSKSIKLCSRIISKEELMHVLCIIQKTKKPIQKPQLAKKRRATEEKLKQTKPVQTSTTRKEKKKANPNAVRISQRDQNQLTNRHWMQEVRLKLTNLSNMMYLCLAS